jgi:uncharacterized protein (DUF4415 family)
MKSKTKAKDIIVQVSEEEYQRELAAGLQDDEVLQPGTHKFQRGGFLARQGGQPKAAQVKVRISINLDLDVLNYFKQRAAQPQAAPYQTQINNTLREVMEKDGSQAVSQVETLLADQRFIRAVARQIQSLHATPRKRKAA